MIRPELKVGDLCRYHKSTQNQRKQKGRTGKAIDPLMVVVNAPMRGTSDGKTMITVRYLSGSVEGTGLKGQRKFQIRRRNLWKCSAKKKGEQSTNLVQEVMHLVGMR